MCAVGADPWMDAQDGDITKPITFTTLEQTETSAKVLMRYVYKLGHERSQKQVVLLLKRTSPYDCYLIDDLVGPDGDSFINALESWHREYGK